MAEVTGAEYEALLRQAEDAVKAGKKYEAISKIFEAETGVILTHAQAKGLGDTFLTYVLLAAKSNGKLITRHGTFNVVNVKGREGVVKFKGVATPWKTEDHLELKFKSSDALNKILAAEDVVQALVSE